MSSHCLKRADELVNSEQPLFDQSGHSSVSPCSLYESSIHSNFSQTKAFSMSVCPHILLTNDDGYDSPLLLPTIAALRELGDLTIAVPESEQSWRAKSMTRVDPVTVKNITLGGLPAYTISGTPADCVNLAIYNLMENKPDCVVSGTNIGGNIGLSYLLSSGTVGACIEGNIAGVPGLALSQHLTSEIFQGWVKQRAFAPKTLAHLQALIHDLIPQVWADLGPSLTQELVTWNINFPYEPLENAIKHTRLGQSFYNQCFQRSASGAYFHELSAFKFDPHPQADSTVVHNGYISVTQLDIRTLSEMSISTKKGD